MDVGVIRVSSGKVEQGCQGPSVTSGMGCGKYARTPSVTQIRSGRLLGRALAQFGIRKSPFVQCFVLDWGHNGLGRGGKRDPKHCTKEFRGAGATARRV